MCICISLGQGAYFFYEVHTNMDCSVAIVLGQLVRASPTVSYSRCYCCNIAAMFKIWGIRSAIYSRYLWWYLARVLPCALGVNTTCSLLIVMPTFETKLLLQSSFSSKNCEDTVRSSKLPLLNQFPEVIRKYNCVKINSQVLAFTDSKISIGTTVIKFKQTQQSGNNFDRWYHALK